MEAGKPLWIPSQEALHASPMGQFMQQSNSRFGLDMRNFRDLHAWSVADRESFWAMIWDFCAVKGTPGSRVLSPDKQMIDVGFFPDATLNFAENLLKGDGLGEAVLFRGEDKVEDRWSWRRLRDLVSRLQQAYEAIGIAKGDRICAMMPNMPETVAAMLAAASLGAIWSSCSPDFGEQGVLDRFGQIGPKLFIACDGYWYAGKRQDVKEKVVAVARVLQVPLVVMPYVGGGAAIAAAVDNGFTLEDFIAPYQPAQLHYELLPFSHPLYIMFSSGTTGVPKCIVHSAGGTLLQHLKEQILHCGVQPGDKLFYFTTCGWMMWNWLVSGLAAGATLCLYDGSPFAPDSGALLDYAQKEEFAVFGTSAKYIDALRKSGLVPKDHYDLKRLRLVASTGSPLSPEGFDFIYQAVKPDVQLASISGGTDIVSCFVLGNPLEPVHRGEIQGPGLGMAVEVWNDDGKPVLGEKGELVCTQAFPSMPLKFWNDPDGRKYRAAYFDRFSNIWCHGDFAEWTANGGIVIHGRSDATLNPGGVRIGTAEIYNQVEQMEEIAEALCIGQDWDGDVRVVLFVRLSPGRTLTEDLVKAVKSNIRSGASPRHVPAKIIAVDDIPRTKSGKIVELAVRDIVHGRPVKNKEALANPEALALFEDLAELRS